MPFAVVALLGTVAAIGLLAAAALGLLLLGRRQFAEWPAMGALAVGAGYVGVLFALAGFSEEKILARGDRKYFCEIDCHLAYSVESASVSGSALTVAVRTWFDPDTISAFRGDAPLMPNPRVVWAESVAGDRVRPSRIAGTPLTTALHPAESYRTVLTFRLPPGFRPRRLFLGDPPGFENALLGHENSPGHRRIYFGLE